MVLKRFEPVPNICMYIYMYVCNRLSTPQCGGIIQLYIAICDVTAALFVSRGKAQDKCPLCGASYMPDYKGTVCKICLVSHVLAFPYPSTILCVSTN